MLSLIKDKRIAPFDNLPSDFYFNIKSKYLNNPNPIIFYHYRDVVKEIGSSKSFLKKIIEYYWVRNSKKRVLWEKYQNNEQGEREKVPYLLFDEGLLYYYPTKKIVGAFLVSDKTLTLILHFNMIKEEKSLLKISEYKSPINDINLLIVGDLEVEKKFNFIKLEESKFESFIKKIAENEN